MTNTEDDQRRSAAEEEVSGRDKATESEPTKTGHSTAETQEERNKEDEPPS